MQPLRYALTHPAMQTRSRRAVPWARIEGGGMVTGGVIGLFIGPVMLAVAYKLFWRWVRDQPPSDTSKKQTQV